MPRRSSTGESLRSAPFSPALANALRVEAVDFAKAQN
jgi:hypothetical protein